MANRFRTMSEHERREAFLAHPAETRIEIIEMAMRMPLAHGPKLEERMKPDDVLFAGYIYRLCPVHKTPFRVFGSGLDGSKIYCSRQCAVEATGAIRSARVARQLNRVLRSNETPAQRIERLRAEVEKLNAKIEKEAKHIGS